MRYILSTLILLIAIASHAQIVERADSENVHVFVNRLISEGATLAHHIIETNRWSYPEKMVIACYGFNDTTSITADTNKFEQIQGHVYLPVSHYHYKDLSFGPIGNDGGNTEIVSIFFANADRDTTKEIFLLCRYPVANYDFEGTAYQVYIYDNPAAGNTLPTLEELSKTFYGQEGKWRDGTLNKAKYKTAKEIRAKLKQMGYRQ